MDPVESSKSARLLAVVEVPQADRVICQAPQCGRPVFKRIHIVGNDKDLQVLGSDCFSRIYRDSIRHSPHYGGSEGRRLSDEERRMLVENTAGLLAKFEQERVEIERAARAKQAAKEGHDAVQRQSISTPRSVGPSAEDIRLYEAQAKLDVRAKYKVDPDLPGWIGLVLYRIKQLAADASRQAPPSSRVESNQ